MFEMVLNTNLLLTVIFPSILFYEEGAGWWQWEVVFIGRTTLRITVTVRITWLKFFFFLFALHCIFFYVSLHCIFNPAKDFFD